MKNLTKKTAKRDYNINLDGKTFKSNRTYEALADASFFSRIEEQIREDFPGEQLHKVDHVSRIICLNYI